MINLTGLSLGIAAFIFVWQYIAFERSVNQFHTQAEVLYRIISTDDNGQYTETTAPGLAALAQQQQADIARYCRVAEGYDLGHGIVSGQDPQHGTYSFREEVFAYVDGNFFTMFSFPLVKGSTTALMAPQTAALSRSYATKYFGTADPIGKVVTLNNQFGSTDYTIVNIYEDMPEDSDLRYPIVFSLSTLASKANLNGNEAWASLDGVGAMWLNAYVQLQPTASPADVSKALTQAWHAHGTDTARAVTLQPLRHMHLAESLSDSLPVTGSLSAVYLLSGVAGLLVLIAWFNFVNLSTAMALKRAREVGIRKVSGASRRQLMGYFLTESLLLNLMSWVVALALVNILQPLFNVLAGHTLSLAILATPSTWISGSVLLLAGALASGGYTAFVLSAYQPVQVLKGKFAGTPQGFNLRQVLVVAQFCISVFLIATTWVLQQQIQFLQHTTLGMNLDQLLVIQGPEVGRDETFRDRSAAFDNRLRQYSFIRHMSRSANVPLEGYNWSAPGLTRQQASPEEGRQSFSFLMIDDQYFTTYEMKLVAGTPFTAEQCQKKFSEVDALIINETAARALGWSKADDALLQKVKLDNQLYTIQGVVGDYHHLSLRTAIEPMVFIPRYSGGMYTLKLEASAMQEHLKTLEQEFKQYFPGNPFTYYFLDDTYQRQYEAEIRYQGLFTAAAMLAVIIACCGLFGLATYSVEQRTKEIGIRKVLGASVAQISVMLTREFLRLVLVAIVLAAPLSWYAAATWLDHFAYKISPGVGMLLVSGMVTVLLAVLAVSIRAFQAATHPPVDALRSE